MKVTCGIPTLGRYDTLAHTLHSVVMQTHQDMEIILVDDNPTPVDVRTLPAFQHLFQLMNFKGIAWKVLFGAKKGQHWSHQLIQDEAKTEWIWRVDDDEVVEPNVLERLLTLAKPGVGAIGGLVPQGPLTPCPKNAVNSIADLSAPNLQWFSFPKDTPMPAEHLHSSFLYRKGIAKYDLNLSPAAHREETIFTHEIHRAGFKLLVDPTAITWHIRADRGGIRAHQHAAHFWEQDEKIFQAYLTEWGVGMAAGAKVVVLDAGMGDHVVAKTLMPELKKKYGRVLVAATFPDILSDDDVELISIADATQRFGPLDRFNVYRWMIDKNWQGSLQDAYRGLFNL